MPCGRCAAAEYDETDVDFRGSSDIDGTRLEIWIYPDDLELIYEDKSVTYEHQEFAGDSTQQVREFAALVQAKLCEAKSIK